MSSLREEVARLAAVVEQQQTLSQRQQAEIEAQRTEIAELREQRTNGVAQRTTTTTRRRAARAGSQARSGSASRASSRRALLKWGGAAAAAATVALVASEGQGAHAAPAPDHANLVIGQANTGTAQTSLAITGTSAVSPFFQVDASASTFTSGGLGPVALAGIADVPNTNTSDISAAGVYGESLYGFGVYGLSTHGPGVYGTSTDDFGVQGQSTNSFGVFGGSSGAADAIHGEATSGAGVYGFSEVGISLYAAGGVGTGGRIFSLPYLTAGAPTSGTFSKGEMIRDLNGELWLCVADGTPGHWVQASHAVYGYTGGATSYLSKPIRLLDTRSGATDALTNGGGPYTVGGSPYPVTIAGVSFMGVNVPASCAGAIGNVTVVAGGGGGYLALVPHGAGFSGTANLAYGPGQTVSNAFNVGLSVDGKLDIIIGGNPTNVILDLFAVVA